MQENWQIKHLKSSSNLTWTSDQIVRILHCIFVRYIDVLYVQRFVYNVIIIEKTHILLFLYFPWAKSSKLKVKGRDVQFCYFTSLCGKGSGVQFNGKIINFLQIWREIKFEMLLYVFVFVFIKYLHRIIGKKQIR